MIYYKIKIFKSYIYFDYFIYSSKGIGANMLKVGSKRRRTKQEIEDSKQEEELK